MTIGLRSPGKYIQGPGEINNLGKHAKGMGNKFLVLATKNNIARVGEDIRAGLEAVEKEVYFYEFGGECSKAEIAACEEAAKANDCDVIVGVGGGKAIDTAKAAATNLGGLTCIIIPTVASNDSPCSGVAVIYNDEGVVIKALMMKRNPDLVLVDTAVIAKAPQRLLVAGIGDALATWFEARACYNSGARTMARGTCSNTALMMSKLCHDMLIENGKGALEAVQAGEANQALEDVVEASVYLSGVGFESGGLAAAHAINDGFAYVPQAHGMYHGEKVAYGTLTQLILEKADEAEMEETMTFMKEVGLPMTLAELGITDVKEEEIRKVAEAATAPKQSTGNLSKDITADDVYAAIMKADELGRAFLAK